MQHRDIGKRVRDLRRESHVSQEQLARMAGVHVFSIQHIENGFATRIKTLSCIAYALGVSLNYLISGRLEDWNVEADVGNLGNTIKKIRKENKLSAKALGTATGLGARKIYRIELKGQDVCLHTLARIAQGLGVSILEILSRTAEES